MSIFIGRDSKRFVDVSLSFEPNPITRDLPTINNERAINNSLKNLMMIAVSEVPFNADIGSGVGSYLFEHVDEVTAEVLQQEIQRVIVFSEPRVELVSPLDAQSIDGNMNYSISGTQGLDNRDFAPISSGQQFANQFAPVRVESRPDQNMFSVNITYKIVGYEQIFTFNQLLEPTR